MALGGFADGAAAAKRPRGHPRAIELGEDGDMPGTTMCMPGYIVCPLTTMGAMSMPIGSTTAGTGPDAVGVLAPATGVAMASRPAATVAATAWVRIRIDLSCLWPIEMIVAATLQVTCPAEPLLLAEGTDLRG
jgi:hypothetical protein